MSSEILQPAEVRRLARIVDCHCRLHGIRSTEGRESVAAATFAHYGRGSKDTDELLAILAHEDDPGLHTINPPGQSGYSAPPPTAPAIAESAQTLLAKSSGG
jgi:hypothetical protein